ncbi:MAG: hypothetical protein IIY28_01520 [Lachnospiraceae bacterium]|nr:hypothetical protein [Lachnospiraceae bacterium]
MAYTTVTEVAAGFRTLTTAEQALATELIDEATIIIDSTGSTASADIKRIVSDRTVRRALGDTQSFPLGATQGSVAAGGYSQSWTMGANGSSGELYISKLERRMLGLGNLIGSRSPVEDLVLDSGN